MPGVDDVTGDRVVLCLTTLFITLPLAVGRTAPLLVLVLVLGAAAVQQMLTTPTEGLSALAAMMVAAYSASAFAAPRTAWAGGSVIVLSAALVGRDLGDSAFLALVLGAAWLAGLVVGERRQQIEDLAEDNRALADRLAAATNLLAEAETRHSPPTGADEETRLDNLTPREVEVVRAIADGMNNAEIAASLFISEWTVKSQVASVLRKLGLRDRAQVVVVAFRSGFVAPGEHSSRD